MNLGPPPLPPGWLYALGDRRGNITTVVGTRDGSTAFKACNAALADGTAWFARYWHPRSHYLAQRVDGTAWRAHWITFDRKGVDPKQGLALIECACGNLFDMDLFDLDENTSEAMTPNGHVVRVATCPVCLTQEKPRDDEY